MKTPSNFFKKKLVGVFSYLKLEGVLTKKNYRVFLEGDQQKNIKKFKKIQNFL